MKRSECIESFKRRGGALLLLTMTCGLIEALFVARHHLIDGFFSDPLTLFIEQSLAFAPLICFALFALTRYRPEWQWRRETVSLLIGLVGGAAIVAVAQTPRWITVNPAVSFSDPMIDVILIFGTAVGIAVAEEVLFRRFFDAAFSAIFGSWLGGALQIALFVGGHKPFASPLPLLSIMDQTMFAIVATQLARSRLGLMSAIGLHVAVDALLWIGFGTVWPISSVVGTHPLLGAVRMLPDSDWPVFALLAALIGAMWIKHPDWWKQPMWFRSRWNLSRLPRRGAREEKAT